MGLFIRQDENRSQLQERLAAELRKRAKTAGTSSEPLDQSTKSNYIKDTEQTSGRAWIVFVVVGIIVAGLVVFIATRP